MNPPVRVREAGVEDLDFIRKAWRETFLSGGPAVQGAAKGHYHDEMTRVFSAIFPNASARIACDLDDPDTRLAFVVYTGETLHYAYVEQNMRRFGLVPTLLDGVPIKRYNFNTIQGFRRLKPNVRGWAFNPCFTFGAYRHNGE